MTTAQTPERKKARQKPILTPVGIAAYPKLLGEPDTKFNAAGTWGVKWKSNIAKPGVQALVDKIESVIAEAKALAAADADYMKNLKLKKKKLSEADRSFTVDEDTGEVVVNFKMTASGKSKKTGKEWTRRPAVFDATNQPIAQDTKLGSGSEIVVAFLIEPFYTAIGYGASLRLEAVQVKKLVEWGQGDASAYGFEAETSGDDEDETATAGSEDEEGTATAGSDDF